MVKTRCQKYFFAKKINNRNRFQYKLKHQLLETTMKQMEFDKMAKTAMR